MKESTIETTIIKIEDKYGQCLADENKSISKPPSIKKERPAGYVEIYEGTEENKKLLGVSNLVVYSGREWVAQKLFHVNNPLAVAEKARSSFGHYICWVGVGEGGCLNDDHLAPTSPANQNQDLSSPTFFNNTEEYYGQEVDGYYYKMPIDVENVTFEEDIDNESYYLITRIIITIGIGDCNDKYLNEIGLFSAANRNSGHNGPFNLYARTTFPTQVKTSSRQLIFVWYIYV